MAANIRDVARLAGVSITTVSQILNKKQDFPVREETRKRVIDAARELHYIPNPIARSLVQQKTRLVGMAVPDLRNPFFTEIALGCQEAAAQRGYRLQIANTNEDFESELQQLHEFTAEKMDGIILVPAARRDSRKEQSSIFNLPIVNVDRKAGYPDIRGSVYVNSEKGAYEAVSYLLRRGRKRIAFLAGPLSSKTVTDRLEGFRKALEENGLSYSEKDVFEGGFEQNWGFMITEKIISSESPYDAFFCGDDLIALGAISALQKKGLQVPGDVAVIGFDDIFVSELIYPKLTTVRQPSYDLGLRSMELLIQNIESEQDVPEKIITLESEFITRESA